MALLLWLRSNRKKPLHRLFNALKPGHEKADEEKPSPRIHILQKPNSLKILLIQWKTGGIKSTTQIFANEGVILQQNDDFLQLFTCEGAPFRGVFGAKTQGFP